MKSSAKHATEDYSSRSSVQEDADKFRTFEDVLEYAGTSSLSQYFIIFYCSISGGLSALQIMGSGFLGKVPNYWCQVEELVQANWTPEEIKNFASPNNKSCEYLNYNYSVAAKLGYETVMADLSLVPKSNGTSECQHRYFEEGVYTIVTEWDLVCDNLAAYSTTYAAVQVGILIGSLVFGYLIGRLGRRRVLLITSVLFSPAAFLTAAATSVSVFTALRVITNMAVIGMYFAGFVLCIEICSLSQRSLVSSYFVLPWTLGYMGTAAIAYFVRPWRYLQAALSTPSVLVFMYYWVVPESPRWLCQRGRHEEALDVLKTFAKKNKRILPDDEKMIAALQRVQPSALAPADSNNKKKNDCCWALRRWFKDWIAPQLDWKTPIVFFIWFAAAMVYYGVSQGASNFGLDEYLFVFIGGLLEIFAYLLLWPGVALLGSRTVVSITFAVTAASILGVMGLQIAGQSGENIWLALLSYLGKFMISAAFHAAYIVTGELFSTNLRSLMIGESSVCARIGSMSSPYVNNLMGRDYSWAPAAFYGVFSMLATILAAVLPQTKGVALDIHQSSNKDQSKGNTCPVESTPHEETRL